MDSRAGRGGGCEATGRIWECLARERPSICREAPVYVDLWQDGRMQGRRAGPELGEGVATVVCSGMCSESVTRNIERRRAVDLCLGHG